MADPIYPAGNNAEAITLNISNANQFFTVLQGDIDASIPTYEGNGEIPSVAKALNEAAAYRVPLPWETTGSATDLMQPYEYNNNIYVPLRVPAPFSVAPDEQHWRLYSVRSLYDIVSESYFTGIEITQHNQLIKDNGVYWLIAPDTPLPYTTTGAGLPEGGAFVSVGDAVLRQELGSNTAGQGSDLSTHTGTSDTVTEALDKRTVFVGSVAELEALPPIDGQSVYLPTGGRGGSFVFVAGDQSSNVTGDPQKGVWIAPDSDPTGGSGAYRRTEVNRTYNAAWFGVISDMMTDETVKIGQILQSLGAGSLLHIPPGTVWDYNAVEGDHPDDVTIIDESGYDYDATGRFSAQHRTIMKTGDPGTKNANNFFLQSNWNPALIIKNTQPRVLGQSPQPQASLVFEDGDTRTYQIVTELYNDIPLLAIRSIYDSFSSGFQMQGSDNVDGTAYAFNTTPSTATPFQFKAKNTGNAIYRWFSNTTDDATLVQVFKGSTEVQRTTYNTDGSITFNDRINGKTITFTVEGGIKQSYRSGTGDPTDVVTPDYLGEEYYRADGKNFYKACGITSADWKLIT